MRKKDIPVSLFIRISKKEHESPRALLIARDEKGKEYKFIYLSGNDYYQDLTVEELSPDSFPAKK